MCVDRMKKIPCVFPMGQRGVSLIELIIFIIIVSTALAGILMVMNHTTMHSADTLVQKQAQAIAESMLEEIELQDFTSQFGPTVPVTQQNRTSAYHIVTDYNNFATTGIYAADNTGNAPIAGLGNYNLTVAVAHAALTPNPPAIAVPAASSVQITVTVTDPTGQNTVMNGYRTAY